MTANNRRLADESGSGVGFCAMGVGKLDGNGGASNDASKPKVEAASCRLSPLDKRQDAASTLSQKIKKPDPGRVRTGVFGYY